jgi:N-acetylglucosamine repressor
LIAPHGAVTVASMNHSQIGNSKLIAAVNCRLVLQAVRFMQPTYRAAVARKTGLKPATMTSIVNDLIERKMLREIVNPAAPGRSGRPPLMLELNRDVKRVLAIDLEPDRIRVASTDLLLRIVEYRESSVDRFSAPDSVCEEILSLCAQVREGVDDSQIQGVGVSLPGQIDKENGILISSTNMPQWRNVPVTAILGRGLGLPVRVERSLHLAALYEGWSDPRLQNRTVLILSLRTGIGLSVLHRGELYTGNLGFDGEIGHTVVALDGPQCECGSRGCLETFVNSSAICGRAHVELNSGRCAELKRVLAGGASLSPELIYELGGAGDMECAWIVRDVGRYLGVACANLINLLAPHEIVVCGSIARAGEMVLHAMREEINRSALPGSREHVKLRLAPEREKMPLLGAAALVAQELFDLPKLHHATAEESFSFEEVNPTSDNMAGRMQLRRLGVKRTKCGSISNASSHRRGEYYA